MIRMNKSIVNGAGIVIKSYQPYKNKVALIDKAHGRVDAIVSHGVFMSGSFMSYHLEQRDNGMFLLKDPILEEVPFDLARQDILFLHHLLELCYHFIPVASCVAGVFDLLQFLYSADKRLWNNATKKLFLFRILMAIGLYSSQLALENEVIGELMYAPFGTLDTAELATRYAYSIDRWLHACVREHPYVQKFNTIHFLTRE